MVAVRIAAEPENIRYFEHAEILGPAQLCSHYEDPLPEARSKGICYLVTKAAIRVHVSTVKPIPAKEGC